MNTLLRILADLKARIWDEETAQASAPGIGDLSGYIEGVVRSEVAKIPPPVAGQIQYEAVGSDRALVANKAYATDGLARLNFTLPQSNNGEKIILFAANLAGFRITPQTQRIQHGDATTAVNGYVDSMIQGTHIQLEKSVNAWIMTIFTGYCRIE